MSDLHQTRTAWVVANGELRYPALLRAQLRDSDLLIAVDGGLSHLVDLGLLPAVLIGDLDSVNPDDQERLVQLGIPVIRYPPEKNETDLELALQWALDSGVRRIRIAAACGDRLDHTLANLFLLTRAGFEGLDIRLDDGWQEAFMIRANGGPASVTIAGKPGDLISLLPLSEPAAGVTTHHLEYPLNADTLFPDRTRGISNVMLEDEAGVELVSGLLICIHTRGTSSPQR